MPFKANADRRHHVTNRKEYYAALRRRCGSLTVWVTDAPIAAWRAAPRITTGDAACRASDHEPAGRDTGGAAAAASGNRAAALLVDSTGLKLCGAGEWLIQKHGTKKRRSWRKLHIGVDADTGQIVAAEVTTNDVDDASRVGPLLDQVTDAVASFTGDGGYDRDYVQAAAAGRHPEAAVVAPPRSTVVPSETADTGPTQRGRHLQMIAERGRMGWQQAAGYNRRALVEAAISRWKRVIGDALWFRTVNDRARPQRVNSHVRATAW